MILDRKTAPQRFPSTAIAALDYDPVVISKGLNCYEVEGGTEDIVKIDVVFRAGARYQAKPLLASVCLNTLQEGSENYSSQHISETIDFYGAELSKNLYKDYAEISLLCQGKHLSNLIDVFVDIFMHPTFPEDKVALYKSRAKSALAVNMEKVEFKCRMLYSSLLFENHPYNTSFGVSDFDDISVGDLRSFFRSNYQLGHALCIISGKNTSIAREKLEEAIAKKVERVDKRLALGEIKGWEFRVREEWERKSGSLQSAVRMGRDAIFRTHPDYAALYFANTALGGYFGSRLMQNIREEKGYTYGISSVISILEYASYLSISTQVGAGFTKHTVEEIKKELDIISIQPMSFDEIELVKFYISGNLLRRFDGPFATASRLKSVLLNGLSKDWYQNFLHDIFALDAERILRVSELYLRPEKFTLAVVGDF